jgi:translation initiation factor 1
LVGAVIKSHRFFTKRSRIEIAMSKENNRTVWSSEQGDLRRQKQAPAGARSLPPQQQTAYLHRESGGRGGKALTLVKNLVLSTEDLKALAKKLKQECGTGGRSKMA